MSIAFADSAVTPVYILTHIYRFFWGIDQLSVLLAWTCIMLNMQLAALTLVAHIVEPVFMIYALLNELAQTIQK